MFNIDKKYNSDIQLYCELNNIQNVNSFVSECFKQGFDIKKYGLLGKTLNEGEKHLIKEVIVEKRVEVPVEVIIEKEVIKEVPVEKVVTKVEYISDKTTEDELGGIIAKLKNEMSKKDEELDELRRNLDELLDKPPVEIIKEVEVIKENENDKKIKMMGETLQKLRKELSLKDEKIEDLENKNKQLENIKVNQNAVYLKGSNLTQRM